MHDTYAPTRDQRAGSPSNDGAGRPIESASGSTACQTNDSKFAYILTAGVLGLGCLVLVAIALLLYSVFTAKGTYQNLSADVELAPYGELPDGQWYEYDSRYWYFN